MNLPGRVVEIVRALYEANKNLALGSDEDRRALTIKINEQIAFELGSQWGAKRADSGRPISKDAIAFNAAPDLFIWDWQDGTTRGPSSFMAAGVPGKNVGEGQPEGPQVFVPVSPTNHLGAVPAPAAGGQSGSQPPPAPGVPAAAIDWTPVVSALNVVVGGLSALATQAKEHDDANERRYRDVVAHFEALPKPTPAPAPSVPSGSINIGDLVKLGATIADMFNRPAATK